MYGELIDIPLLIYEPDRERLEVCDTVVSNIDIPPTILQVFGMKPAEAFEGHSLLPLGEYPVGGCYGEALDIDPAQKEGEPKEVHYYRQGDLKIIYREKGDSWELYDLERDPGELTNLMGASPAAEAMKQKVLPRIGRSRRMT
jgi:choline-sulfatase